MGSRRTCLIVCRKSQYSVLIPIGAARETRSGACGASPAPVFRGMYRALSELYKDAHANSSKCRVARRKRLSREPSFSRRLRSGLSPQCSLACSSSRQTHSRNLVRGGAPDIARTRLVAQCSFPSSLSLSLSLFIFSLTAVCHLGGGREGRPCSSLRISASRT